MKIKIRGDNKWLVLDASPSQLVVEMAHEDDDSLVMYLTADMARDVRRFLELAYPTTGT